MDKMLTKDFIRKEVFETISKDGKWWIRKVARKLELDSTTVWRRVNELEEIGKIEVIKGYKNYLEVKEND